MARIFITGSSDGLGQLAASALVKQGHQVVLHGRNAARAKDALLAVPGAEDVLIGDLSDMAETKQLAADANALGTFDSIIHNAGVYRSSGEEIFAVNTLAPYTLTCLMHRPKRLIYLSSGSHRGGSARNLETVFAKRRASYADSRLHVIMLALAVARKWPEVYANAVNPGWVPTKMGGPYAPDDLQEGFETQVWLAVSNDPEALQSGRYLFHKQEHNFLKDGADIAAQEKLLALCEEITGVKFPG